MTQIEKIRQTTDLLRALLKNEKYIVKMDLYWDLLQECMDKSPENAEYIGDKWTQYLRAKVLFLDRRKEELIEIEKQKKI